MIQTPDVSNYNDLSALQGLKSASTKDTREGIKAVAEQFESLFISMMLKSMREANKGLSEGNILSSNESEFYQEMFDSQISVSLAGKNGGGIGLAEVIERQILESKGLVPSDLSIANKKMSLSDYERKGFPRLEPAKLVEAMQQVDQLSAKQANDASNEENASLLTSGTSELKKTVFNSPNDFIASLAPIAQKIEAQTGISAKLMLAQSALETGWGNKPILREDGAPSFNLFGIKANNGWQGDSTNILTTEFHQGVALKQRDSFRTYQSYEESFADYAKFLEGNPRYEEALSMKEQPIAFAQALQQSGYATDPEYANKIGNIVQNRLSDMDAIFQSVKGGN
ncbi:hypothetical protein A3762_04810 [Oleiphilus sp. HI0125]|uniref:flagellar assembly peptidoglycan hydrolase FlgJ n=2 Tax=Oleiphilus sp. HI0125 TaxID=1822266 RepID=UPI0007C3BBC2|nr:flagellar assembly peptidoglycan hydrolase FlgJ [Oleiphilus sp. HI0125]KZZ59414.1 hypothetical protein A3762_04810 [Oleiphilus sp. HI0125]